ncbi:unnamed protein product [Bubo scandiacus]
MSPPADVPKVVDGFFVKRTGGPQESAAYLGVLGEQLQRCYGGPGAAGVVGGRDRPGPPRTPRGSLRPPAIPAPARGGGARTRPRPWATSLPGSCCSWGGVSGGRAAAILRRFPTPASLMAAYGSCPDPQQRQALLSTLKCGPLQRNLGPSLSRSLARLYGTAGATALRVTPACTPLAPLCHLPPIVTPPNKVPTPVGRVSTGTRTHTR